MKFTGREKEIECLESQYSSKHPFVVITGRKRIGKTRLVSEFIKGKKALCFPATEETDNMNLENFASALSAYTGRTHGRYRDWPSAFDAFSESDTGRKILIIDEFQNIIRSNPAFPSILRAVWDSSLSKNDTMLIICGSDARLIEKYTMYYSGPLYGRATANIKLGPLPFKETCRDKNYKDAVERYSVIGGVPKYMESFDRKSSLIENINTNIFDSTSFLFEEPYFLLRGELREPLNYISILKAVANHNRKTSDISSVMDVESSSLSPYIQKLIEKGMLRKTVPVTERNPEKSKLGQYEIEDEYMNFWFRFVYPHMQQISMGNTAGAEADFKNRFINDHVSYVFKELCRELTYDLGDSIGFVPFRTGAYWNRSRSIDVVAINDDEKRIFAADCEYLNLTKVDGYALESLKAKCSLTEEFRGYKITYGMFSVSGFDDDLIAKAGKREVVLINNGKPV